MMALKRSSSVLDVLRRFASDKVPLWWVHFEVELEAAGGTLLLWMEVAPPPQVLNTSLALCTSPMTLSAVRPHWKDLIHFPEWFRACIRSLPKEEIRVTSAALSPCFGTSD